jgi:diacylglycerol kinase family enzyme
VLIGRALTRRHRPDRRLELLRARQVRVVTRRSEPRQIDGDLIDDGRGFTIVVEPGALVVRVPRPGAQKEKSA